MERRTSGHRPPRRVPPGRIALLAGLLAAGCGGTAQFAPTENTQQIGRNLEAAYYDVKVGDRTLGDVRLWSPGAYEQKTNGEHPVITVSVRLRNDGDGPLRLDLGRTALEVITEDRDFLVVEEESRVEGTLDVPPGGIERVTLTYTLPEGAKMGDLDGFELSWAVDTTAGLYTQSTPFVRERRGDRYAWYPYYGFGYYPFYRPIGPYFGYWGYPYF